MATQHFSLLDFVQPKFDFLEVYKILHQVHVDCKILPEAISQVERQMMILAYRFILSSRDLFRIRPGKEPLHAMMMEYVAERERNFSCQVIDSAFFEDSSIELFDNETSSKKDRKKRKINEKSYTLANYFRNIGRKFMVGEVGLNGQTEANRAITNVKKISQKKGEDMQTAARLTCKYKPLMDLVLKNFDYDPSILVKEDRKVDYIFIGLTALLEYLIAEVVELAGNASQDNVSNWVSVNSLGMATSHDEELKQIMSNMVFIPPIDLAFLYGWDMEEIPSITVMATQNSAFHTIQHELHSTVLKFFDDANELMNMRLVCKNWNYLILKDQDIWKNLTFHSLIRENIFTTIDSSFTMEEMETILSNSTSSPNNRKSIHVKMIKHFMENNNWFNINYLLVRKNMITLNFIRRKMKKYNVMQDSADFRLAVYGQTNHLVTDPMEIIGTSKSGGNPHIHKSKMEDFTKLTEKFEFIGQINCKELSPFLSARLLPKTGMIYFFIEGVSCLKQQALVLYHDCDTEHLIELKDTKFKTSTMEMLVSLTEGPLFSSSSDEFEEESFERIGNLLNVTTQRDTSFCGAISSSVLNNASFRPQAKQDEVVLFSTFISGDNQYEVISFMIGSDMLRKRRFSEARVDVSNVYGG